MSACRRVHPENTSYTCANSPVHPGVIATRIGLQGASSPHAGCAHGDNVDEHGFATALRAENRPHARLIRSSTPMRIMMHLEW